jgi:hypothetical protein
MVPHRTPGFRVITMANRVSTIGDRKEGTKKGHQEVAFEVDRHCSRADFTLLWRSLQRLFLFCNDR